VKLYIVDHNVRLTDTWNAFVFGAVFNVIAASPNETLIYYAIKTIIGGAIWLAFQIVADRYKQKDKDRDKANENKKKVDEEPKRPGRP
jgi:hypothetical protein